MRTVFHSQSLLPPLCLDASAPKEGGAPMVIAVQHDLGSDDRTLMGCGGPEGPRSGLSG